MKTLRIILACICALLFITVLALTLMFFAMNWEGDIIGTVFLNYTDFFPYLVLWILLLILITLSSMLKN